jgi:uncharacterized protein
VVSDERWAGADTDDGPVTVAVSRTVKAGAEAAFEEWLRGVCGVATQFPGHMGVSVLSPADAQSRTYVLIFRFDTLQHLAAWNESAERAEWIARARPLTTGEPRVQVTTGLEHWFPAPAGSGPPPRHKMALLTWLILFPLVLTLPAAVTPHLAMLPWPLPTAVITAAMVTLMTYVVMPRVTKVFRHWLFRS